MLHMKSAADRERDADWTTPLDAAQAGLPARRPGSRSPTTSASIRTRPISRRSSTRSRRGIRNDHHRDGPCREVPADRAMARPARADPDGRQLASRRPTRPSGRRPTAPPTGVITQTGSSIEGIGAGLPNAADDRGVYQDDREVPRLHRVHRLPKAAMALAEAMQRAKLDRPRQNRRRDGEDQYGGDARQRSLSTAATTPTRMR